VTISRTNPAQSVQVARISPGQPVALATVSAHDAVSHSVSQQELPSDMCRRVDCIVGINADFHDTNTDEPFGGVVSGGRLVRSPSAADQLTVAHNGTLQAGRLDWSGSLTAADGTTTALGGFNVDRIRAPSSSTPPPGERRPRPVRAASSSCGPPARSGSRSDHTPADRRLPDGPRARPADGAVLSADGDQATPWPPCGPGSGPTPWPTPSNSRSTPAPATWPRASASVRSCCGTGSASSRLNDGLTAFRAPRTLVGWNAAGEVVIVTVDGRQDTGAGMNPGDASDLLLALGPRTG